jgi:hypothetical protein
MLIPANLKHFHPDPRHPFYSERTKHIMEKGKLVVTVNNEPVSHLTAFDVANGFVKTYVEPVRYDPLGRPVTVRRKGKVMVFVEEGV